MKKFSILLVIVTFGLGLKAQSFDSKLDELAFLNDVMANAFEYEHKKRAGDNFGTLLREILNEEGSYTYDFEALKWMSVKSPESREFKVFTWFVQLEEHKYELYGLVQMKGGELIELKDQSFMMSDVEYMETGPEQWFGALYYKIQEQKFEGEDIFLLYGYHPGNEKKKMKVLEVLSFRDGKPVFGKEIFKKVEENGRERFKNRIFLEYALTSNVNLNYNDGLELIMFDNLISTITPELGPTKIPDGSYKAYKKDGDTWVYVDKVYNHISNIPISDGRKNRQEGLRKN